MDAIRLLERQHRLIEKLFMAFEESHDTEEKKQLFFAIADNLVMHATIEERHFYPAVRDRQTEEQVVEAYDEHLEIKKLILDALASCDSPAFDATVAALEGCVCYHLTEEEDELFPSVRKLFTCEAMEALGQAMEVEAEAIMAAGDPRNAIRMESEQPAAVL